MKRLWVLGVMLALGGCATAPSAPQEEEPLPAELDSYVLDAVPADIQHRTFIDFEGRVQIVGYSLKPEGVIKPGDNVELTLYWKASSKLEPGWRLFTHLLDPTGQRLKDGNKDDVGPLRGAPEHALPPDRWKPGKVYVDTQQFQLPRDVRHATVTVSVGVWKAVEKMNTRLDVISGPHDDERRALVATIPTGIEPPKPVAAKRPE